MMVIFDILIYVVFAFFASFLARKSNEFIRKNGYSTVLWDKYLLWFVAFFTIIGSVRWNVGSDSLSYACWFKYPQIEEHTKEHLWWCFVEGFQRTSMHWSIGLGICAFVQIFFITIALRPYRWLLVFVPFLFFGGRYWMDCMGAVRQMIVGCGFFWASKFIVDRQLVKYIVFICIASTIHQSALILLPFYFLPLNLSIEKQRWKLIAIFIVCIAIGQTPQFAGMSKYVQFIAGAANYDGYSNAFVTLLNAGETDEALKIGPMMLTYMAIPVFVIWYGPELKEEYGKIIPSFNLWYNLAYFYACGYFLVCNISHLFIRPMMYFSLFQMVMAAMVLHYLWTRLKEVGANQLACHLFCLVIFTNTAWDVYKASTSGRIIESTTYKVSFFHNDQKQWFGL